MIDDEMARRRRSTSPAAGPLDDDDLLAEILIRLPPLPSSLPRASLVCKRWRSIVADASFLRLFRARHRPSILGVFGRDSEAGDIVFTSVLDPPDRIPTERLSLRPGGDDVASADSWSVLGSRHGRVLFVNWTLLQLILFDPVSGDRRSMAVPSEFADRGYLVHNGAVLCAASDGPDHLHGDCPFKVVLVGSSSDGSPHPAVAAVYSSESETGMWGDLVTTTEPCTGGPTRHPCTIIGNAVYWSLTGHGDGILEFDFDKHSLNVIDRPPVAPVRSHSWIIRGEDGGVGLALLSYPDFELWDRKVNRHGAATWVLRKTADMNEMLGPKFVNAPIVGYDEDTDAVFMSMHKYPYSHVLSIVQLMSMRVKECRGSFLKAIYLPFTNFYTAGNKVRLANFSDEFDHSDTQLLPAKIVDKNPYCLVLRILFGCQDNI